MEWQGRKGKTREDQMKWSERPRVIAALGRLPENRREAYWASLEQAHSPKK